MFAAAERILTHPAAERILTQPGRVGDAARAGVDYAGERMTSLAVGAEQATKGLRDDIEETASWVMEGADSTLATVTGAVQSVGSMTTSAVQSAGSTTTTAAGKVFAGFEDLRARTQDLPMQMARAPQ